VKKKTLFELLSTLKLRENTFLEVLSVEPFYFILFEKKRLYTAFESVGEALPN